MSSERAMKVAREIVDKWRGTLQIGSGMREIESENLCRRIAAALDAFGPEPVPRSLGEGGWRDISTAPKDGTKFLGWCPPFGIDIVYRNDPGGAARNHKHNYECWAVLHPDHFGYPCRPTHWQPLPSPPQESPHAD